MAERAHASPTKEFFLSMITRDITLHDSIFDLLDNCLDGARSHLRRKGEQRAEAEKYTGYHADITFGQEQFSIADNCGGIPVGTAIEYAFHFGRRKDAPPEADFAVGLYGIGMKRAMFKIGREITVLSSTEDESFVVDVEVDEWAKSEDWDFDLERDAPLGTPGTTIEIEELQKGVGEEFTDPVFHNRLMETIARDYSFFLQKGLAVRVNGAVVRPYNFALRKSADLEPVRRVIEVPDTGVTIDIVAGLSGVPPVDISPENAPSKEAAYYGWFVSCNDRIVVAADKSDLTVWGHDEFPRWHPQYNGFMGLADFRAADPSKLPWTTTKRSIETSDPLYRRAVTAMKEVTRQYIDYTNARKEREEEARQREQQAQLMPVRQLPINPNMKVPAFAALPRIEVAHIGYARPRAEVLRVAEALGNRNLSYKEIGIKTFEYYRDREVEG